MNMFQNKFNFEKSFCQTCPHLIKGLSDTFLAGMSKAAMSMFETYIRQMEEVVQTASNKSQVAGKVKQYFATEYTSPM